MRRAARKDLNQNSIADYLRKLGWSVLDLSRAGDGITDLMVGRPGFACLVECKRPERAGNLTPKQVSVRAKWDGPYIVATSGEDAAAQLLCLMRGWEETRYDL